MICFQEITEDNLDLAIGITVMPDQEVVIVPVSYSLAQCFVLSDILKPFLILNNHEPVGFILFLIDESEKQYEICRLMINRHHQHKGYGKKALLLAIEYLKNAGTRKIELSHQTSNYGVGALYQGIGFTYTGDIKDGEVMMELQIDADQN